MTGCHMLILGPVNSNVALIKWPAHQMTPYRLKSNNNKNTWNGFKITAWVIITNLHMLCTKILLSRSRLHSTVQYSWDSYSILWSCPVDNSKSVHCYGFQELLEKRRQLMLDFETYRQQMEDLFIANRDRRLALRDGECNTDVSRQTSIMLEWTFSSVTRH